MLGHCHTIPTRVSKCVHECTKKGHSQTTEDMRKIVVKFAKAHQFVCNSPNCKDTLKIECQLAGKLNLTLWCLGAPW